MKKFILLSVLLVLPAQSFAQDLDLRCKGSGTVSKKEKAEFSNNQSGTITGHFDTEKDFSGTVYVKVRGDDSTIKIPSALQSGLIDLSDDGDWYDINDVEISPDEISGVTPISLLNFVDVTIDRHSGTIELDGVGKSFSGECEAIERSAGPKF